MIIATQQNPFSKQFMNVLASVIYEPRAAFLAWWPIGQQLLETDIANHRVYYSFMGENEQKILWLLLNEETT